MKKYPVLGIYWENERNFKESVVFFKVLADCPKPYFVRL